MSIAQIGEGYYRLPPGYGLLPGEYVVRITSERPTGKQVQPASYSEDRQPIDVYEQFLPAKYNQQSELMLTITPESSVDHDFELSLK